MKTTLCMILAICAMAVHRESMGSEVITLVSDYELQGSYADSSGSGPGLIAIGGTLDVDGFTFGSGEGLRLDTPITQSDYLIELDVSFSNLDGWDKLIDFEDRTDDAGLYLEPDQDFLILFPSGESSFSILETNIPYTIGLKRVGNTVSVILDDLEEFTADDTGGIAASSVDRLHFFLDDFQVIGDEVSGTVTGIRLFTVTAVPEPASTAMIGAICFAVAAARRRRRF